MFTVYAESAGAKPLGSTDNRSEALRIAEAAAAEHGNSEVYEAGKGLVFVVTRHGISSVDPHPGAR